MRFRRYDVTKEPYRPDPGRRLAAAKRRIERERASVPMFADQIVTQTPEERVEQLAEDSRAWSVAMRQHQAATWRLARRALDRLPRERRLALRQEWDSHRWLPGSAEYFADFLRTNAVPMDDGHTEKGKERDHED